MVVVVEAGGFQPRGLRRGQHAERRAGLEPERLDAGDHRADLIEIAILRRAPGGAHAEARRAARLRRSRLGDDGVAPHQLAGFDAGLVMRALRAIGAILGTAAGLDRQQGRELDLARVEMPAMRELRAENQLRQRQIEQRGDLVARPIVPHGFVARESGINCAPSVEQPVAYRYTRPGSSMRSLDEFAAAKLRDLEAATAVVP